ncbi:MAG: archease [Chitinispirillaceae bacterium]
MPYEFLEEVAMADVAFHAWGKTLYGLFSAAADAMLDVMVEEPSSVNPLLERTIAVEEESEEMLLHSVLEELIYYKDAQSLLLRLDGGAIESRGDKLFFEGTASGEEIDIERHRMSIDVKAVTMHLFRLYRKQDSWHCTVVLDI